MAFGFDAGRLLVWLDDLVDDDRAKAGALCQRHAERLTSPKGWWLDDRRVAVPDLFQAKAPVPTPAPAPAASSQAPARRTSRRRSRKPAPEAVAPVVEEPPVAPVAPLPENLVPFSGFDDGSAAVEPSLPPPGAVAPAVPPPPPVAAVKTEPEAIDPIFEPSTPLLARAFTGVARPDRPHHRQRRPDRPDPEG